MSDVRVRFAPSPTGSLHVGSARTALYNFLFARHQGGTMVLRIEDTDLKRSTGEHDASIMRDLEWLGLQADEGPDVGGAFGPYRQSERAGLYESGVQQLVAGGWAYPCFCPQEKLDELKAIQLARGDMPKYDGCCLRLGVDEVQARLASGEEAAIRFQVPAGDISFDDLIHGPITFSSEVIGDFIIKRTDGGFAYNFAVVIDDAGMQITHVIRGEDHITNTARQLMLLAALGKPAPRYGHHSLILAPDGSKLSKRHGATSIGDFRGLGYLPAALVNFLALLSWHPGDEREKFTLGQLVEEFDMDRVSKSPAIFDVQKLNWLNGLYIRELGAGELYHLMEPYLADAGMTFAPIQREVVAEAVQANLVVLGDAPRFADVFVEDVDPTACPYADTLLAPGADVLLQLARHALEELPGEYVSTEEAKAVLRELMEAAKGEGLKGKSIYQPLRVALSGRDQGPELFYLLAGLGKGKILSRLASASAFVATHPGACAS